MYAPVDMKFDLLITAAARKSPNQAQECLASDIAIRPSSTRGTPNESSLTESLREVAKGTTAGQFNRRQH